MDRGREGREREGGRDGRGREGGTGEGGREGGTEREREKERKREREREREEERERKRKREVPMIPSKSIIVMDNAPYYSHRKEPLPVKSWMKAMLTEWLPCKGFSYPEQCLKCHLWSIVEKN